MSSPLLDAFKRGLDDHLTGRSERFLLWWEVGRRTFKESSKQNRCGLWVRTKDPPEFNSSSAP